MPANSKSKINSFLSSMTVEYLSVDIMQIFLVVSLVSSGGAVSMGVAIPAAALIGPVFVGPISGFFIDRISRQRIWYFALLLGFTVPIFIWKSPFLSDSWIIFGVVGVSVLAYIGATSRVVASKFIVDDEHMDFFHGALIWIMQSIPIIAALLVSLMIWLDLQGITTLVWMGSMLIGALVFRGILLRCVPHVQKESARHGSAGDQLKSAFTEIFTVSIFRYSIFVAGIVNFCVFAISYISVATINVEIAFFGRSLPLVFVGLGALGAPLAKVYLNKFGDQLLLTLAYFVSVGLLGTTFFFYDLWVTLVFNGVAGFFGATVAMVTWNIRLRVASKKNIGAIAGLTGAMYKLPSILLLPLVGILSDVIGAAQACFVFTLCFVVLWVIYRLLPVNRIVSSEKIDE